LITKNGQPISGHNGCEIIFVGMSACLKRWTKQRAVILIYLNSITIEFRVA